MISAEAIIPLGHEKVRDDHRSENVHVETAVDVNLLRLASRLKINVFCEYGKMQSSLDDYCNVLIICKRRVFSEWASKDAWRDLRAKFSDINSWQMTVKLREDNLLTFLDWGVSSFFLHLFLLTMYLFLFSFNSFHGF